MRRQAILLALVVGIALGVAGSILTPRLARLYLPQVIRGKTELIEGAVVRKQREADRLLLTVVSERGAILATFKKKIAEINLLVEEGDSLTLALSGYNPFVDDPPIEQVRKRKAEGTAQGGGTGPPPSAEGDSRVRAPQ